MRYVHTMHYTFTIFHLLSMQIYTNTKPYNATYGQNFDI